MKKIPAFISFILILFTLCSCALIDDTNDGINTGTTIDDSTVTTDPSVTTKPDQSHIPGIGTSVQGGVSSVQRHMTVSESGTTALTVNLSLPVAEIDDNEAVRDKVNQKIESITEDIYEYIDNVKSVYTSAVKSGAKMLETPSLTVGFTLNYFTEKAMSFTFTFTEINGNGEVARNCRYYNFELDSYGAEITLDNLFSDLSSDNRGEIIKLIKDRAAARNDLYPGYESELESLASVSWYLSGSKIVFRYDPYTLAPASAGFITFEFETSMLARYMSSYGRDLLGIS